MNNSGNPTDSANSNVKNSSLSFSIKKCGTGDNWSVEPGAPPFYLMSHECPVSEAKESGSKNLLHLNNLESAYQKFCVKRLKEELSAFLPNVCGRVNVSASEDGSGLIDLLQRPPVGGKDLLTFNQSQLDHAFRLHPGPLPQEYLNLFLNVNNNEGGNSSTENSPQHYLNSQNQPSNKKRRRDSHKNSLIFSSTNASSTSSQLSSNQQQNQEPNPHTPQQSQLNHQSAHENPPGLIPASNSNIPPLSTNNQAMPSSIKRANTIPGTNVSGSGFNQNVPSNPPPLHHNFNNPNVQNFPPASGFAFKPNFNQPDDPQYSNSSDDRKKKKKEKKKKREREAF